MEKFIKINNIIINVKSINYITRSACFIKINYCENKYEVINIHRNKYIKEKINEAKQLNKNCLFDMHYINMRVEYFLSNSDDNMLNIDDEINDDLNTDIKTFNEQKEVYDDIF